MRTIAFTLVGLIAVAIGSTQAAPLPPANTLAPELGVAPAIRLVRDGCGHSWHRLHWRDQWGYWHWGDCVPDGDPYRGWGEGWNYWRGPYRGWGNPGWGNP
ncbi:MAG TPA: hypothetical protein VE687_19525 [Stellaceae bacterium]|jgi:hypothetical protein|nr:hypothetical protein [Stellaceae bacterium]